MFNDFKDKRILVTDGAAGVGLASGLAFGRLGARVFLTHRGDGVDEEGIYGAFQKAGAPRPVLIQADAASPGDAEALFRVLAEGGRPVEILVSPLDFPRAVRGWKDYNIKGVTRSIEYGAWPLVSYTLKIKETFDRWPRYVVGLSSCGPDVYHKGHDFSAAAKAVLETLCRYMSHRLFEEECRVNVVRARWVDGESFSEAFGRDFKPFVEELGLPEAFQTPEEIADAVLALCSGWMDGVRGQVLTVDNGTGFFDNTMRMYAERGEGRTRESGKAGK